MLQERLDKKYNTTTLKRIRQFYWLIEKGAPLEHQLTWSHYRELLPMKDINQVKYYINQIIERQLTKRALITIIKSNEYMNYIDKNLTTIEEDKTIGIIIVRKDNINYIEYCSNPKILVREYKLEK